MRRLKVVNSRVRDQHKRYPSRVESEEADSNSALLSLFRVRWSALGRKASMMV